MKNLTSFTAQLLTYCQEAQEENRTSKHMLVLVHPRLGPVELRATTVAPLLKLARTKYGAATRAALCTVGKKDVVITHAFLRPFKEETREYAFPLTEDAFRRLPTPQERSLVVLGGEA